MVVIAPARSRTSEGACGYAGGHAKVYDEVVIAGSDGQAAHVQDAPRVKREIGRRLEQGPRIRGDARRDFVRGVQPGRQVLRRDEQPGRKGEVRVYATETGAKVVCERSAARPSLGGGPGPQDAGLAGSTPRSGCTRRPVGSSEGIRGLPPAKNGAQ